MPNGFPWCVVSLDAKSNKSNTFYVLNCGFMSIIGVPGGLWKEVFGQDKKTKKRKEENKMLRG